MYCKLICVAPNGLEKTSPKAMQCHTYQQFIHMCNSQLDNLGFLLGLSLSGRYSEIGHIRIVQFQKISILLPQKGLGFPGGGGVEGSVRPKYLKKCMKFNWNFQRGRWGLRKKYPFRGGGMDIFWNYTFLVLKWSYI